MRLCGCVCLWMYYSCDILYISIRTTYYFLRWDVINKARNQRMIDGGDPSFLYISACRAVSTVKIYRKIKLNNVILCL